jgi:hypothetical protein
MHLKSDLLIQFRLSLLLFQSFFVLNISGQVSWDNDAANYLWSDPLNWTGDLVPQASDDVIIGSGYTVIVDGDYDCASLTLEDNTANTSLTLNSYCKYKPYAKFRGYPNYFRSSQLWFSYKWKQPDH